jgi:hypothetical protein
MCTGTDTLHQAVFHGPRFFPHYDSILLYVLSLSGDNEFQVGGFGSGLEVAHGSVLTFLRLSFSLREPSFWEQALPLLEAIGQNWVTQCPYVQRRQRDHCFS